MAIYRYSPESIDSLSRKTWWIHTAMFATFILVACVALFTLTGFPVAIFGSAIYTVGMAVAVVGLRQRARQRIAKMIRSAEIEIDDEKISYRDQLRTKAIYRAEVVAAHFLKSGISLAAKGRRDRIHIPSQIEDFDQLSNSLETWLPPEVVRSTTPPSQLWASTQVYGGWVALALLLYAAMASQVRVIAIPACVLVAVGIAWLFAWSGSKIEERKWKVLLPLTGYLAAAVLLVRAWSLWASH